MKQDLESLSLLAALPRIGLWISWVQAGQALLKFQLVHAQNAVTV